MADLGAKGLFGTLPFRELLGPVPPPPRPRFLVTGVGVQNYYVGHLALAQVSHRPTNLQVDFPSGIAMASGLIGDMPMVGGAGRSGSEGNPAAPSQAQVFPSMLRGIRWRVTAGARSFSIDAKYPNTAPRLHFRNNPSIGLSTPVTVTGEAGDDTWKTLNYNFTALDTGVIEVWRERTDENICQALYWDNIVVT